MPITVSMQVPSAVASRSVGEKLSPFPSLSFGASVSSTAPDGTCRALVCSSPSYSDLDANAHVFLPRQPFIASTSAMARSSSRMCGPMRFIT